MLILTRKIGEKLIIGDNIIVKVLGVSGNQLRFGIEAPKTLAVHREEIYNKIQEQQQTQQQEEKQFSPQESLMLGTSPVMAISG